MVEDGAGGLLAAVKGAPERVLRLCALEPCARAEWEQRVSALAGEGSKVIACASQVLDSSAWRGGEPERGFRFLGLVAFEDGVNDVPALQAADVGIAMGERGTRGAREASSIVLLDDDFGTLVRAIAEGRQLFLNLQRCFMYLLLIHIPLVTTAALLPLAGYPLLYLPIHIVWLELIIHPTAMLAFQAAANPWRLGPVRSRRQGPARFFSPAEWVTLALVGGLMTVGLVWGYDRSLGAGRDVEHGRAVALASLTLASAGFAAVLTALRTRTARWVCALSLGGSVVLIQVPPLADMLGLHPLHADDWTRVVVGVAVALLPLLSRQRASLWRQRGSRPGSARYPLRPPRVA